MLHSWANSSEECCSFLTSRILSFPKHATGADDSRFLADLQRPSVSHSLFFLFAFSVILCLSLRRKHKRRAKVLPIDAVQALSAVFTPTSSAWPAKFAYFFKSAYIRQSRSDGQKKSGQGNIEIDLSDVIDHILAGNIEPRDPSDLGELFHGSLKIYAWHIRLRVGWGWWFGVVRWLVGQHFLGSDGTMPKQPPGLDGGMPVIDLDFVAFQDLEKSIRSIKDQYPPSSTITLEFSSIKPESRFMSPGFILCAIGLLPRWTSNASCTEHGTAARTSTPLFIQLQDVVACITATKPFKITSITNISAQREASLLNEERDLVENRETRTHTVTEVGIEGWREARLRLAWEAGLLRAGLLHRWRIELNK